MKNKEIADIFEKMADILEFKGENVFKVNAYRKAARVIQDLPVDIASLYAQQRLRDIPGIGEGISSKIGEFLETGRIKKFEEERKGISDELLSLLGIPGLGPKTLALIHKNKGIDTLDALEEAASKGKLRDLPGMGSKKEENILRGIRLFRESAQRIPLGFALPATEQIIEELKATTGIELISYAGSLRRMKETVGDIDILASSENGKAIIEKFTKRPQVKQVLAAGETKSSVIVEEGFQMDLRVVPEESYGAALQYFTGSKAHNIKLREMAKAQGLKINEYGLFKGDKKLAGRHEEEIYSYFGLDFIPAVLREDRGEIEASLSHSLPHLVQEDDIRGDFHVHSLYSDGSGTIEQVALKCKEMGYDYVVITDHSPSLKIARGLDAKRLTQKMEEMGEVRKRLKGIELLFGTEMDILSDGKLDYPDDILKRFDIVVASIHSGFKQDIKTITNRVIKAMQNPYVDIIAHPTGRLISSREPYQIDLEEVMKVAAETGTALEINAYYDRLDLTDIACKRAKELGVKMVIGTDAHHLDQLWMMRLGVAVAQRGWLEREDLLNTLSPNELKAWKKKRLKK